MATAKSKDSLQQTVFQDSQLPGSITASDMRDFVESVPAWMLAGGGWEFVYDTTTTFAATADTNLVLPLVPDVTQTARFPSTFQIWDSVNNKVLPPNLNDAGILRLSFQAEYTGSQPHIDIHLDVGTVPLNLAATIYDGSQVFAKGASTPQWFNFMIPLFAGQTFVDNGGTFIVHSHGGNSTISNIALTSFRIFASSPGVI